MKDLMREYHRRSDHGRDGADLHSFTCNCLELFAEHEIAIRADERERMAAEAKERGDIGRPDQIEVWDWLRSDSAAHCKPRSWVRSHMPAIPT